MEGAEMKTVPVIKENGQYVVKLADGKPGWQTTEFWTQIIKVIGSIFFASGVMNPGTVEVAPGMTTQLVGPIMQILGALGFLGSYKGINQYGAGRVELKK
jgi:hypothetical protein